MKVFLVVRGKKHVAVVNSNGESVRVNVDCPACGETAPIAVAGTDMHRSDDDLAYESTAVCLKCKRAIGTLRAEPNTVFGISEDERVLHGSWRVY